MTYILAERLFLEERRRLKIIPNAFGEKAVLKLMFAAMTRAAERWRAIRIADFERHQMAALRQELDREYEAQSGLAKPTSKGTPNRQISSRSRTYMRPAVSRCFDPRIGAWSHSVAHATSTYIRSGLSSRTKVLHASLCEGIEAPRGMGPILTEACRSHVRERSHILLGSLYRPVSCQALNAAPSGTRPVSR